MFFHYYGDGYGGIDIYTNAISDIYQDIWCKGSFTGKGIYNVRIFSKILDKQIPENTVLSHDLLEGNFLRCGLVTNIEFIDGFPKTMLSYMLRQNRWLRGDIQVLKWCGFKVKVNGKRLINPLGKLEKWKLLDNIRRGMLNIDICLIIIISILLNINWIYVVIFLLVIYLLPSILDKLFSMRNICRKSKMYNHMVGNFEGSIYRMVLEIVFLPYMAYTNLKAILKSIYRICISKKNMLEWVTAEEADKLLKNNIVTYIRQMFVSIVLGVILLLLSCNIFGIVISALWILSPVIAWYISQDKKDNVKINCEDRKFLNRIAKDTWLYFEDNMIIDNNYLIPDNYQENRKPQYVKRTSSTNIGISFMACITAFDLGFIDREQCKEYIENILSTINKLKKYKGNLYNWYNIKTLEPLNNRISSVDNGNYISYLYVLKQFCIEVFNDKELIKCIDNNIQQLDFSILFNQEKQLFSIEYDVDKGELSNSYYDLLASEARTLSYVAIAKGDIPYYHWNYLSRVLVGRNKYNGLISWTGTAFEYFMPDLLMKSYKYSLLDETYSFVYHSQKEYAQRRKIPYGVSESAFNLYDLEYNYQYKAFGIPWLGLKRGLRKDVVVSPYSSVLMLNRNASEGIYNLKKYISYNVYGKYGFFDALDCTKTRQDNNKNVVVKTFMAHHQGMILMGINNVLNNNCFKNRFNKNPEISSIDILLKEKALKSVIADNISGGYDEKDVKSNIVEIGVDEYINKTKYNSISNKNYSILMDVKGQGYSKLDDIYIYDNNSFRIYVKDIKENKAINCFINANHNFNMYSSNYNNQENDLDIQVSISTLEKCFGEMRNIKIRNTGDIDKNIEIYIYYEPVLTQINNYKVHRAYSNLFLKYKTIDNGVIVTRNRKSIHERNIFVGTKIIAKNNIEFENDRYKIIGRNNSIDNANILNKNVDFNSAGIVIEPAVCFKINCIIAKDEIKNISCVINIADTEELCMNNLNMYNTEEDIKDELLLSYNKAIIECKFYNYTLNQYNESNILINNMFEKNKNKIIINKKEDNINLQQRILWKYSISGDKNIVLINIGSKLECIYLGRIISEYKYIKRKCIDFDLIFLIDCKHQYVQNIFDEIIYNLNLYLLKNDIKQGIYILNKNIIEKDVTILLECLASNTIYCSKYKNYFKSFENNREKKVLNVYNKNEPNKYIIDTSKLRFFNGIGGFDTETDEYVIVLNNNNTPAPWCNILSNKSFGTILSESGCVYTWCNNSSQNKLSKWSNNQIDNKSSEYIILKDRINNKQWSTSIYPNKVDEATYLIRHGKGYTCYENYINGIYVKQTTFVPLEDNLKICECMVKNIKNVSKELEMTYYIDLLMGNEINKKIYEVEYIKDGILIKNKYSNDFSNSIMYCFSKDSDIEIDKKICIQNVITLHPGEISKIIYIIGQEDSREKIDLMLKKYNKYVDIRGEYIKVKEYWDKMCNSIVVKTPVESMNILMNGWLIYQVLSSRLNAKTGFYQSSGAIGFRDQLQDVLSIMHINPEKARKQILLHASHQYIEGDVMHWWHEYNNAGIRSRYSDDLLWLVYVTLEYIKITGDEDILDVQVSYVKSSILKDDEKERYEIPDISNEQESLFIHLCKAMDRSIILADNNLPNIGSGDWSDGLNNVYGQSIWLALYMYAILNNLLPLLKNRDMQRYNWYSIQKEKLKNGIDNSWDGKWYKRAIFKNGEDLGSSQNDECKIDVIVQAWASIAEYYDIEKRNISMQSVDEMLVDRENRIIKLFTPSFNKTIMKPGYIKSYLPGIRENGGQYTHGAIWAIMAQCINKKGNKAEEYFRMLNPIEHSNTFDGMQKYKIEPYVISADIYSANGLEGRGGWSWYTGSASWMYKVGLEYILGIKINKNTMIIEPCISSIWNKYEVWYKNYHIVVQNPNHKEAGVEKVFLDNNLIDNKLINLDYNKKHEILVIM